MATQLLRRPAVAGSFYPAAPGALHSLVEDLLLQADAPPLRPAAIVTPHAGLAYSGRLAALAWRCAASRKPRRIVLIGPSHRVYLTGLASSPASHWLTPLGSVSLDTEAAAGLEDMGLVQPLATAHAQEHCLEVQLPFVQRLFPAAQLLPLVVGEAGPEQVAAVIEALWNEDETLIAISTDLSHFHDDATARRLDAATARAIEGRDIAAIGPQQACGCRPLNGLLHCATATSLRITRLGLCNSSDASGDRSRVVGYGAFALHRDNAH